MALHEQRPDLDRDIIDTTSDHVEAYLARLSKITPELTEKKDPVPLFAPQKALLWGPYDHATFFLSDDLEAVEQVSYGTGATTQEFLFGSPYLFESTDHGLPMGLGELLQPDDSKAFPLLAISRIKLGDHLLATLGGGLREAVARRIFERTKDIAAELNEQAEAENPGVDGRSVRLTSLILRCWSWPDLVVIYLADDPAALTRAIDIPEHLTVDDILPRGSDFRQQLQAALRHPRPRQLLEIWTQGKEEALKRKGSLGRTRRLFKSLGQCDVVVSEKTQIGIPLAGWKRFAPKVIGRAAKDLFTAMSCAFEPRSSGKIMKRIEDGEKLGLATLLADVHRRTNSGSRSQHPFHARIKVLAKPGHASLVEDFVSRLLLSEMSPGAVEISQSCGGQGAALVLSLAVPPTRDGFFFLFCLSHSFRVCAFIHQHLMDISTSLEWQTSQERSLDSYSTPNGSTGFNLLRLKSSQSIRDLRRFRSMQAGVGRVQGLALRALQSAVRQTGSRPEFFGAILELDAVALAMDSDLIFGRQDVSRVLARGLKDLMSYAQKAYQQRLQFSPILSGAPPLNGQLPYGVNQIVRTVDGLSTILTAASLLPFAGSDHEQFGRSYRKLIVIFEADAAIGVRHIHDFGILQLSLLQAKTPLSLTALFHELGHLLVRRWCWHHRTASPMDVHNEGLEEWNNEIRRWSHIRTRLTDLMRSKFDREKENIYDQAMSSPSVEGGISSSRGHWNERVETFLDDVFSHAVWRRVGCGGEFELFQTQFLAVQAMGIRREALHLDFSSTIDAWALSAIHLGLQKALFEAGESVEKGMERFIAAPLGGDFDEWWVELFDEVLRFAEGEIHHACEADSSSDADPKQALMSRASVWLVSLGWMCHGIEQAIDYRQQLESFFESVVSLEQVLEQQHRTLWEQSATYRNISSNIRRGLPVGMDLPWENLVEDNGHPGPGSLLWMRSVLNAVTEHFVDSTGVRDERSMCIRRDHQLTLVKPRKGKLHGLYADFIGGLFIAGKNERRDYQRVRLAAIESLSDLASRTQAEGLRRRFLRQRTFKRSPVRKCTVLRINGKAQNVYVRDISAGGLGLEVAKGIDAKAWSNVKVETTQGKFLECRLVWQKSIDSVERVGLALLEPWFEGREPIERAPQREEMWVKIKTAS